MSVGTTDEPATQSAETSIPSAASFFALAADPTRLKILVLLREEELHVKELCRRLGQTQPAVSHHLALLRVAGVVESRREAKFNFYSVTDKGRVILTAFDAVAA